MRSVWIWWWCLYGSSLCLKTPVSSLLNLALKAMKLETLCAKTKPDKSFTTSRCALVRIRLRVGLKFCTYKNRLSKKPLIGLKRLSPTRGCPFVCIKFWVPTKVTAESLISPVIINRRIPWPSLKRRHSRWSVRETRRRGQRFLNFGGDENIFLGLIWRGAESLSWDCFLSVRKNALADHYGSIWAVQNGFAVSFQS